MAEILILKSYKPILIQSLFWITASQSIFLFTMIWRGWEMNWQNWQKWLCCDCSFILLEKKTSGCTSNINLLMNKFLNGVMAIYRMPTINMKNWSKRLMGIDVWTECPHSHLLIAKITHCWIWNKNLSAVAFASIVVHEMSSLSSFIVDSWIIQIYGHLSTTDYSCERKSQWFMFRRSYDFEN